MNEFLQSFCDLKTMKIDLSSENAKVYNYDYISGFKGPNSFIVDGKVISFVKDKSKDKKEDNKVINNGDGTITFNLKEDDKNIVGDLFIDGKKIDTNVYPIYLVGETNTSKFYYLCKSDGFNSFILKEYKDGKIDIVSKKVDDVSNVYSDGSIAYIENSSEQLIKDNITIPFVETKTEDTSSKLSKNVLFVYRNGKSTKIDSDVNYLYKDAELGIILHIVRSDLK